jgi:hypothetical protein
LLTDQKNGEKLMIFSNLPPEFLKKKITVFILFFIKNLSRFPGKIFHFFGLKNGAFFEQILPQKVPGINLKIGSIFGKKPVCFWGSKSDGSDQNWGPKSIDTWVKKKSFF